MTRTHAVSMAAGFCAAALAWLGLIGAQLGEPTVASRWAFDNYAVKRAILASAPGPRLIVVGGSSGLFDIRADILSRELRMPVVNFSNHAGLNLPYMLEQVEQVARPGDTLLLAMEYELYARDPWEINDYLMDYLAARDPGYLFRQRPDRLLRALMGMRVSRILQGYGHGVPHYVAQPTSAYVHPHMDAFGDSLGNNPVLKDDHSRYILATMGSLWIEVQDENFALMGAFVERCRARGIGLLAVMPPMKDWPEYGRAPFSAEIARIAAWHARAGIPLLLGFDAARFPAREMFDSRYHLDAVAAERYTRRLLDPLREATRSLPRGPEWRPAAPEHAIARVARDFHGWEPVSGGVAFEGSVWPGPEGLWAWLAPGAAPLAARVVGDGPAVMRVVARASIAGDVLGLRLRGEALARCALDLSRDTELVVPIGMLHDHDEVQLLHGGRVMLRALTIDPLERGAPAPRAAGCAP